jgi:hypothetical protein
MPFFFKKKMVFFLHTPCLMKRNMSLSLKACFALILLNACGSTSIPTVLTVSTPGSITPLTTTATSKGLPFYANPTPSPSPLPSGNATSNGSLTINGSNSGTISVTTSSILTAAFTAPANVFYNQARSIPLYCLSATVELDDSSGASQGSSTAYLIQGSGYNAGYCHGAQTNSVINFAGNLNKGNSGSYSLKISNVQTDACYFFAPTLPFPYNCAYYSGYSSPLSTQMKSLPEAGYNVTLNYQIWANTVQ